MPVTLTGLGHRFGEGPWLFQGVDARIDSGEVVALTGPSGSGKSTLLSIIAGWQTPTRGTVTLTATKDAQNGEASESTPAISWVFQNPHGVSGRTIVDHVALPFLARGLAPDEADQRARVLLEDFALTNVATQTFKTVSGGEAQRMLLARALASSPDVLLVDEPTAQLDQRTAHHVANTLTALRDRGLVVIIATHDPHVRDRCTRIIDLADYAPEGDAPDGKNADA